MSQSPNDFSYVKLKSLQTTTAKEPKPTATLTQQIITVNNRRNMKNYFQVVPQK